MNQEMSSARNRETERSDRNVNLKFDDNSIISGIFDDDDDNDNKITSMPNKSISPELNKENLQSSLCSYKSTLT